MPQGYKTEAELQKSIQDKAEKEERLSLIREKAKNLYPNNHTFDNDVSAIEHSLSYIEPHEAKEVDELIIKELGFEPPRPCGYQILVKIYTRPEDYHTIQREDGTTVSILLSNIYTSNDKWSSCVGLVMKLGPDAYKTGHFKRNSSNMVWCRPGDFVIIPRHEGTLITYKDIPFMILPDDRILAVVQDPQDVRRD
jgi:co-chaperonin GroES (HSP10)